MQESKIKYALIGLFTIAAVFGVIVLATIVSKSPGDAGALGTSTDTGDGKQMVEILAKGGYSPTTINADANKETILRIKTQGTFDCSTALVIPELGIRKYLPPTGNTDISIPAQSAGTRLAGTCSMGMYNFEIKFN